VGPGSAQRLAVSGCVPYCVERQGFQLPGYFLSQPADSGRPRVRTGDVKPDRMVKAVGSGQAKLANSLQKVASPLIWWKRGLSGRFGGFAPSLLFQVGRAAMHHFEMVTVTAFRRTKNRCGRLPFRIGQVTPSVVRIERVAAMYAGLDLRLGSHIGQGTRHGPKSLDMACNSKQSRFAPAN